MNYENSPQSKYFVLAQKLEQKAASQRILLRLPIRHMANGSLHTSSVGRIRVNFLGFDRLPAYVLSKPDCRCCR